MVKGKFKTAYDAREIVLDVPVADTLLEVGQLVKLDGSGKLTAASSKTDAAYMVAQSDMTMEYGHVPVEDRNYAYSNKVAKSETAKKVAVFPLTDKDDVIEYTPA